MLDGMAHKPGKFLAIVESVRDISISRSLQDFNRSRAWGRNDGLSQAECLQNNI